MKNLSFALRPALAVLACACVLSRPAVAQSDASLVMSALPLASVGLYASEMSGVSDALSDAAMDMTDLALTLSAAGGQLVVTAVQASARGVVLVLKRASDGVAVSVQLSADAVQAAGLAVGASVQATATGAGVILSTAGRVLCLIPNAAGRALFHQERIR